MPDRMSNIVLFEIQGNIFNDPFCIVKYWIFLSVKFAEAVGAMIIATVGNVVIYHVKVFHNNPPKNDLGGSYRSVLIRIFCCFCSYRKSFRRISLKRTEVHC